MTLRTLQFGFALALLGSQLTHAQEVLAINGLKAVWRHGTAAGDTAAKCLSTGGYLKNVCTSEQVITFMNDRYWLKKNVSSYVFSDAPQFGLKCRATSQDGETGKYISTGMFTNTNPAPSAVAIPVWLTQYPMYQIDCWLPPGVSVFGAEVMWWP
jgi:hypothetical protein